MSSSENELSGFPDSLFLGFGKMRRCWYVVYFNIEINNKISASEDVFPSFDALIFRAKCQCLLFNNYSQIIDIVRGTVAVINDGIF